MSQPTGATGPAGASSSTSPDNWRCCRFRGDRFEHNTACGLLISSPPALDWADAVFHAILRGAPAPGNGAVARIVEYFGDFALLPEHWQHRPEEVAAALAAIDAVRRRPRRTQRRGSKMTRRRARLRSGHMSQGREQHRLTSMTRDRRMDRQDARMLQHYLRSSGRTSLGVALLRWPPSSHSLL